MSQLRGRTRRNTLSSLVQRLNNSSTTLRRNCFNLWMLSSARRGFHLDVAFMCCAVLSSVRSLSKSLTLVRRLSSQSAHQCKSTILQWIQKASLPRCSRRRHSTNFPLSFPSELLFFPPSLPCSRPIALLSLSCHVLSSCPLSIWADFKSKCRG